MPALMMPKGMLAWDPILPGVMPFWRSEELTTIGNFGTSIDRFNPIWKTGSAGNIVYGNSRCNVLALSSGASTNLTGMPSVAGVGVLVGGRSSDRYMINPGQQVVIADLQGGRCDTVDLTPLDRQNARWGYLAVKNDVLLFDFTSRTSLLLHDPLGKESKDNAIEFLRLDFRKAGQQADGSPFPVDPNRSELVKTKDFLTGLDQQGAPNLGRSLTTAFNALPFLNGLAPLVGGTDPVTGESFAVGTYSGFNIILSALQSFGQANLAGAFQPFIPGDPWPGGFSPAQKAADLAATVMSLPTTDKLGFGDAGPGFAGAQTAVEAAWMAAGANLDMLG